VVVEREQDCDVKDCGFCVEDGEGDIGANGCGVDCRTGDNVGCS
jgi:hypothetical protein